MSKRKPPRQKSAFHRFIYAIFDYYHDRGMPDIPAKVRMFSDVLETLREFAKKTDSGKDHLLVESMRQMRKHISQRGLEIATILKNTNDEQLINELRQALRDLHSLRESIDHFIKTYRGEPRAKE